MVRQLWPDRSTRLADVFVQPWVKPQPPHPSELPRCNKLCLAHNCEVSCLQFDLRSGSLSTTEPLKWQIYHTTTYSLLLFFPFTWNGLHRWYKHILKGGDAWTGIKLVHWRLLHTWHASWPEIERNLDGFPPLMLEISRTSEWEAKYWLDCQLVRLRQRQ